MQSFSSSPPPPLTLNWKIQLGLLITVGFALLNILPIEFPFRHTHAHAPRYDSDDHDVCRGHGWLFTLLLCWYLYLVYQILNCNHAMNQTWAQRLIIWPTIVVGIFGVIASLALLNTYNAHSEYGFAMIMGLVNGVLLLVLASFCFSIARNPLVDGYRYAWEWLFYSSTFFFVLLAIASSYEEQWYIAAISLLNYAPLLVGLLEVKGYAKKQPNKK